MQLGAWLLAMVGPMLGRILTTLGFSVVSIVGLTAVLDGLKTQFLSLVNQVPAAGLQLALLGGAGEAMGIIFGACATRLIIMQAEKGTRLLGVAS